MRTIEAFEKRLAEKTTERFEIFIDYLDLGRFPGDAHSERIARFLAGKYAEAPPDVLIPMGRAAIPFMLKYRDAVAPRSPVIITSVTTRDAIEAAGLTNTVFVTTRYNFAKTLDLARRLQPSANNVVLVAGASDYDLLWVNDARVELEPYQDRYKIRYLVGLPYDALSTQNQRRRNPKAQDANPRVQKCTEGAAYGERNSAYYHLAESSSGSSCLLRR